MNCIKKNIDTYQKASFILVLQERYRPRMIIGEFSHQFYNSFDDDDVNIYNTWRAVKIKFEKTRI